MNIIDLFIKRRKKVERLTKALAREKKWAEECMCGWTDAVEKRRMYELALNSKARYYVEIEHKYVALKAIVLAIDDERITDKYKKALETLAETVHAKHSSGSSYREGVTDAAEEAVLSLYTSSQT